jgi:hypothetical protein
MQRRSTCLLAALPRLTSPVVVTLAFRRYGASATEKGLPGRTHSRRSLALGPYCLCAVTASCLVHRSLARLSQHLWPLIPRRSRCTRLSASAFLHRTSCPLPAGVFPLRGQRHHSCMPSLRRVTRNVVHHPRCRDGCFAPGEWSGASLVHVPPLVPSLSHKVPRPTSTSRLLCRVSAPTHPVAACVALVTSTSPDDE